MAEAMEGDHSQNYRSQAQNPQQERSNPGLTRYKSAPCSYFSNLLDGDLYDEILGRPTSPEMERILDGLIAGNFPARDEVGSRRPEVLGPGKFKVGIFNLQPKEEQESRQSNYSVLTPPPSQSYYQTPSNGPLLTNQSLDVSCSIGGGSSNAGLLRQSSLPAGLLLNNLNAIEGYGALTGIASFGTSPGEASYSPATVFDNPVDYVSAGWPSSSGQMSHVAGNIVNILEGRVLDEGHGTNYETGFFPLDPWNEAEEVQRRKDPPNLLARHLSLPESSLEIEKLLQIHDSIPCKIRAKRGRATHPRSIAERVRRTKISERIRKLQDLVPNMDKQINTSDMLDLAVNYIKDLQEQLKTLSDDKSKCMCSSLLIE